MYYLLTALGIFGLDNGIKNHIEAAEISPEGKRAGFVIIRRHHNRGMALNTWEDRQQTVMLLSCLFTLLMTAAYILTLGRAGGRMLKWGLTLLLGGAYSNTYDRIRRQYVVDYVSFAVPWKRFSALIFNLSDFCIMVGTLLVLFSSKNLDQGA